MAPRPNWKGYLKLSLVSCPIALYPATSGAERVSFRQVNKETGNRLKQQLVDSETGEPVDSENKGRGYEIGKGQFLMVEDEELEAIQVESTHTIEIDSFVPRDQIDERYLDSPYYIAPTDKVGQEAFAVIRESMRDKNMVGIGRVVIARRAAHRRRRADTTRARRRRRIAAARARCGRAVVAARRARRVPVDHGRCVFSRERRTAACADREGQHQQDDASYDGRNSKWFG